MVKPLKAELEKRDLQDTVAEVILAVSIADAMRNIYEDEPIKEIVNKIFPLLFNENFVKESPDLNHGRN